MGKFVYSKVNGSVYYNNPNSLSRDTFVEMTDAECDVYESWVVAMRDAKAAGVRIPRMPKFPLSEAPPAPKPKAKRKPRKQKAEVIVQDLTAGDIEIQDLLEDEPNNK